MKLVMNLFKIFSWTCLVLTLIMMTKEIHQINTLMQKDNECYVLADLAEPSVAKKND